MRSLFAVQVLGRDVWEGSAILVLGVPVRLSMMATQVVAASTEEAGGYGAFMDYYTA